LLSGARFGLERSDAVGDALVVDLGNRLRIADSRSACNDAQALGFRLSMMADAT
jgi:hypothetical protein